MLPKFHLAREQTTKLFSAPVHNVYCDFHFHSHIEFIIVQEGRIEVTINDKQRILTAGQIGIALSYDAHQFRAMGESRSLCIIIPTDLCPEFIAAVGDRKNQNPYLEDAELFSTACACFDGIQSAANPLSEKGYIYVLLGAALRHMQLAQKQESTSHRLLTDLLLYLSAHYTEDITLSSLAAAVGYNPSYLSRHFTESFQIGIPGYINMLRLRQAVLLMRDSGKTITECAFESGFRSLRTFYRAFQEEFHCSPTVYRKDSSI